MQSTILFGQLFSRFYYLTLCDVCIQWKLGDKFEVFFRQQKSMHFSTIIIFRCLLDSLQRLYIFSTFFIVPKRFCSKENFNIRIIISRNTK